MSFGKTSSSSSSRPLTPQERADIYNRGVSEVTNTATNSVTPGYTKASYAAMNGGDYNKLEQSILDSRTAGIDRAKYLDSQKVDSDLAKRGIWSSGLAERAQGDNNERYAANYLQAGGEAATQRFGAEQTDLANKNAFEAAQNDKAYQASWAPLNYYAGLWNGSAGTMSEGKGSGMNAGLGLTIGA